MDESREPIASDPPAQPTPAAPPAPPEPKRRSWKGPLGMGAALVLAFAWGALTYRELGTAHVVTSPPIAVAAVAGAQSPPRWVADFAEAFCGADAKFIASRLGPPLANQVSEIEAAFASREWSCTETRYLGGGTNTSGDFYAYLTTDGNGGEQWWVFTVMDEKVVAIE